MLQLRPPTAEPHREVRDLHTGLTVAEAHRLAWMLLFEASGSERLANDWYDSFAEEVVEPLPSAGPLPSRGEIIAWLESSP